MTDIKYTCFLLLIFFVFKVRRRRFTTLKSSCHQSLYLHICWQQSIRFSGISWNWVVGMSPKKMWNDSVFHIPWIFNNSYFTILNRYNIRPSFEYLRFCWIDIVFQNLKYFSLNPCILIFLSSFFLVSTQNLHFEIQRWRFFFFRTCFY